MTSSLYLLQFHSILADPKYMHSAEKSQLVILLSKNAVFRWAKWSDPILQSIYQAQQANLGGGREKGRELGKEMDR
jgi:hypothetical protein